MVPTHCSRRNVWSLESSVIRIDTLNVSKTIQQRRFQRNNMSEQTPTKPKEKEDSPEPRWIRLLEILLPQLVLAGIFLYGINAVSKRSEDAQINNAEAQAAKAKLDVNEGSVGALQIKGSVQFGRDYSNFNADQRPTRCAVGLFP